MIQRLFLCLLILGLIFSGGCSVLVSSLSEKEDGVKKEQAAGKKSADKKKDKEQVKIPEELEGVPFPPEGKYAGEKYDWLKVKKELNQIPKDADGEQILKKLYALAAEDYTPYFKYYETFDTSIIDVKKGPGGLKNMKLPEEKPVNIVILVDSSGSMAEKVSGGVKMDLAKKAVKQFAGQMPQGADVSLYVYGHKGSNSKKHKRVSCNSIEEVYPLGAYDEGKFNQALNQFKPTGWTPLAAAMEKAKQKLSAHGNAENIVYVVSDGVETCDGDPVQAAKELHESNMKAVVNIIGLDVDNQGQQALQAVAEAGGGKYHSADSGVDLDEVFQEERNRLYNAWSHWANEHYDKASEVGNDKYDDLQRKSNEMYELAEREAKRFYHMTEYLEKERGFTFDLLYNHVRQKFWERRDLIHDYNFAKRDELQQIVLDKKNKIQDEVLDKASEEKDKLY